MATAVRRLPREKSLTWVVKCLTIIARAQISNGQRRSRIGQETDRGIRAQDVDSTRMHRAKWYIGSRVFGSTPAVRKADLVDGIGNRGAVHGSVLIGGGRRVVAIAHDPAMRPLARDGAITWNDGYVVAVAQMVALLAHHDGVAGPVGDVGQSYLAVGVEDATAADLTGLAAALGVAVSLRIGIAQVNGPRNSRIASEHLNASSAVRGAACLKVWQT